MTAVASMNCANPMSSTKQVSRSGFFGSAAPLCRLPCPPRLSVSQPRRQIIRAAQQISADVEKPTGLKFKESKAKGGGLVITSVGGNAKKAGLKVGDTVIYLSSFFGDELWPTDSLGLTNSAMKACPSPVAVVYVKGENNDINVKRLVKKPAPKRFGRKLTEAQKEFATHICSDCGWIYTQKQPFENQPTSFRCPQCQATKKRFARYDPIKEQKVSGTSDSLATAATVVVGLLGIAVLGVLGLKL